MKTVEQLCIEHYGGWHHGMEFTKSGLQNLCEMYASQFKSQLPIIPNPDDLRHALNLIQETIEAMNVGACGSDRLKEAWNTVSDYITKAESQPSPIEGVEREWISVKEREPETSGYYWCFIPNYSTAEQHSCFYNKSKGAWDEDGFGAVDVSHWMPLLSPPKEMLRPSAPQGVNCSVVNRIVTALNKKEDHDEIENTQANFSG